MSERKVLTKYYPPDFDPSKITRTPKHLRPTGPKTISVRLMAPFSMKCTSCGEYIYKGRKFNARKETTEEKYLNIQIYRFYIRCTRCSTEITFKTDPKNMDYTCERGAKRNFEPWRDATSKELQETDEQRLDRLEREEVEAAEEEERNAMEELEQKMQDSKREMQIADALDEIRTRNARIERGEKGGKEEQALAQTRREADLTRIQEEQELEDAVKIAFTKENIERARQEEIEDSHRQNGYSGTTAPVDHGFERISRPRKSNTATLVKKVGQQPVAMAKPPDSAVKSKPPTASLGLAGYGSDNDD